MCGPSLDLVVHYYRLFSILPLDTFHVNEYIWMANVVLEITLQRKIMRIEMTKIESSCLTFLGMIFISMKYMIDFNHLVSSSDTTSAPSHTMISDGPPGTRHRAPANKQGEKEGQAIFLIFHFIAYKKLIIFKFSPYQLYLFSIVANFLKKINYLRTTV